MSNIDNQSTEFRTKYITSSEVRNILMVSRTALHHRRRSGKIPDGIRLDNTVTLWERDQLKPYLEQWSTELYGRVVGGI